MIYVTGDTHGEPSRFDGPQTRKLKKGDSLIVCGDFGFLWDGGPQEEKILKKLGAKKYNILFIDGTHENFDLLARYPVTMWNGGKARNICGNVYHLLRGQVFELEDKTVFTFGGGESREKQMRVDAGKWWEQEMPTRGEMEEGAENLKKHGMKVDYIVTHEPSPRMRALTRAEAEVSPLELFFEELVKSVRFQKWFFGSLHIDRGITPSHRALFSDVVPVDPDQPIRNTKARHLRPRDAKNPAP